MYDLIKDNEIIKTSDLAVDPRLAPMPANKGKWLERIEIPTTEEPTNLQEILVTHFVTTTTSIHQETIVAKFKDIPGGPTQAEQEAIFLAKEFENAYARKQQEINTLFNVESDVLKGTAQPIEIDSFPTQEKEALAYQADSQADVLLLTGLASAREGIDVPELVQRVLANAHTYKLYLGQIMGKKHRYEDQLKEAKTMTDLENIEVV